RFKTGFVEISRRAAADSHARERRLPQGFARSRSLSPQRGQIILREAGRRIGGRKEVAEATAHFTKRRVQIQEKRVAPLRRPYVAQSDRRFERAISGLVRVGVGVSVVRRRSLKRVHHQPPAKRIRRKAQSRPPNG